MLLAVPYRAGVVMDDPDYTSQGYASNSDKMRIVRGYFETKGGRTLASGDPGMIGVARANINWDSNSGTAYAAVGTHRKLYASSGGEIWDVTPFRVSGHGLGAAPFATVNGSTTITVTDSAHGATSNSVVYIGNVVNPVGGVKIGGNTGTLASNPFTTVANSSVVIVTQASHNLNSGVVVSYTNAAAVANIGLNGPYTIYVPSGSTDQYLVQASNVATSSTSGGGNIALFVNYVPYALTRVDANTYTINAGTVATSTTTGGGNGATTYYEINVGLADGVGSQGYGTGAWDAGPYGIQAPGGITTQQAMVWSLVPYGQNLCAAPLNGPIYEWTLNFSNRAATLANAPAQCLSITTTPQRILMALGTVDLNGNFDPLFVRWSDSENETTWNAAVSNLAGSLRLAIGSYGVALRNTIGGTMAWTNTTVNQIVYTNEASQPYEAQPLGTDCGLIGPNAQVDIGGRLWWMTPAAEWYTWAGGVPQPMINPNRNWFIGLLAIGQQYKIFAIPDATYSAVQWHFPSGATNEVDTYIRLDSPELAKDPMGGWSVGTTDETCGSDHGAFSWALAVTLAGKLYFEDIGTSDNGGPITRFVTMSPVELSNPQDGRGTHTLNVSRMVPDIGGNYGTIAITLTTQRWPQDTVFAKGPFVWSGMKKYIDLRIQGRQIGADFRSTGAIDSWRLGVVRLDVGLGSRR